MSGTVSCENVVTSSVSTTSTLTIGNFQWPTSLPSSGAVLKTDGTGNLTFEPQNVRVALLPTDTSYAITATDDIIAITGSLATTLTLPDPALKTVGDLIYIVKEVSGVSVITIVSFGAELVSGNASATLTASFGSVKLYTNGTNWFALF